MTPARSGKRRRTFGRILAALTLIATFTRPLDESSVLANTPSLQTFQGILDQRASSAGIGIVADEIGPGGVTAFEAGSSGTARPLDQHSLFPTGSLTKTFTGTLLALMVLDGSVKLTDPVTEYLPKYVHVPTHGGKAITLLSLATHFSGLPAMPANLVSSRSGYARYSVADLYAFVSSYSLSRDPGQAFNYSSVGISLLGQALANRAGTSYPELLRSRLLEPLGMTETSLFVEPGRARNIPAGRDADEGVLKPLVFGPGLAAATMVYSSMDDLLKYTRCNMGTGPLAAACLFAQKTRRDIPANYRIGLAWWTAKRDGTIQHGGNSPGYHVAIIISEDHTRATIVLANGGLSVEDIAWHTIDAAVPVRLLVRQSSGTVSRAPLDPQTLLDRRTLLPGTGIILADIEPNGVSIFTAGTSGTGRPLDIRSIFEIGSATKTVTGTLLALMVMDGRVRLDDPVQKYLPASVHVPTRNGKVITLFSLATQYSGLPALPADRKGFSAKNPSAPTLSDMYEFVSRYTLRRDPGALYEYSNLGIALLGQALAHREGTSYADLVRRRIFEPLGMTDTTLVLTPEQSKRLAIARDDANRIPAPRTFAALAPAGELRSSLADLLKLARCDMGRGPLAAACLFAQEPRDDIPGNRRIGLTWWTDLADGIIHHASSVRGYHAAIAISADHTRAAIALANGGLPVDDVAEHVLDPSIRVAEPRRFAGLSLPLRPKRNG